MEITQRENEVSLPLIILNPGEADFEEVLIQINYPEKFVNIQHQHVLGTLMSLGIEREQVGDIIVGDSIQFVLTKQLESYIMLN